MGENPTVYLVNGAIYLAGSEKLTCSSGNPSPFVRETLLTAI